MADLFQWLGNRSFRLEANRKSTIGNRQCLVDLARFERATSTSAESRSDSAELQVPKNLAEAAGVEPAHAMRGDLANRCHTIRRRLHRLAEGTGVEPASDQCAVVFKTTALPVRLPFQTFLIADWRLPIIFELARATNWKSTIGNRQCSGACGRTRTNEGQSSPPDFDGGCFCCSAKHARMDFRFQISIGRFQV